MHYATNILSSIDDYLDNEQKPAQDTLIPSSTIRSPTSQPVEKAAQSFEWGVDTRALIDESNNEEDENRSNRRQQQQLTKGFEADRVNFTSRLQVQGSRSGEEIKGQLGSKVGSQGEVEGTGERVEQQVDRHDVGVEVQQGQVWPVGQGIYFWMQLKGCRVIVGSVYTSVNGLKRYRNEQFCGISLLEYSILPVLAALLYKLGASNIGCLRCSWFLYFIYTIVQNSFVTL